MLPSVSFPPIQGAQGPEGPAGTVVLASAVNYTTVGATEETALSYTVPANMLNAPSKYLHIILIGHNDATSNARTVNIKFGAASIAITVSTANGVWQGEAYITRKGANSQRLSVAGTRGGAVFTTVAADAAEVETAEIPLLITMQAQTAGNFTLDTAIVRKIG
jgi:hypothetical protein